MAENSHLLPWILCGTLGAVAATTVVSADSTTGSAPGTSAVSPSPPPPSAHSVVTADLSPVVVSPNARTQLPPGQVWECVIDGQRVFSDAQCGAHASARQLSELNVMDSSAVSSRAAPRPYGRDPGPDYYPPQPASDPGVDESDAGQPIYTGTQVIVVRERARHDHVPHRVNHPHPRAARP